jgi:hypothetical protein
MSVGCDQVGQDLALLSLFHSGKGLDDLSHAEWIIGGSF